MPTRNSAQTEERENRLGLGDWLILVVSVILLATMVLGGRGPAYSTVPDFSDLSVEQKKREFFAYLSPMVSAVNFDMAAAHERVQRLRQAYTEGERLGRFDRRWLARLAGRLEVPIDELELEETLAMLERRAGVVPESLVLVQAAVESGWGSSRFAQEGKNFFGQRCYRPDCGMRPSGVSGDPGFGLARFSSVSDSVESYMLNLNSHPEYASFRRIRERLRASGAAITGLALLPGLSGYSERGQEYVTEIATMIRANGLE